MNTLRYWLQRLWHWRRYRAIPVTGLNPLAVPAGIMMGDAWVDDWAHNFNALRLRSGLTLEQAMLYRLLCDVGQIVMLQRSLLQQQQQANMFGENPFAAVNKAKP